MVLFIAFIFLQRNLKNDIKTLGTDKILLSPAYEYSRSLVAFVEACELEKRCTFMTKKNGVQKIKPAIKRDGGGGLLSKKWLLKENTRKTAVCITPEAAASPFLNDHHTLLV